MTHPAILSGRAGAYLYAFIRARERGDRVVRSEDIGALAGVNATQVRRDLTQMIGRSGKRGVGYRVDALIPLLAPHVQGAGAVLIAAHVLNDEHAVDDDIGMLIRQGAEIAFQIDVRLGARARVQKAAA